MPYFKTTYVCGKTIEVCKGYSKRKKKYESRNARKELTPEEMAKVNQKNAEIALRRVLNANFKEYDLHITCTYRKDQRPTPADAKKLIKKFLNTLRREYRKNGEILKYVHVTEYESTAIHHHIVLNAWEHEDVTRAIKKCWKHGRVFFVHLESNGQYGDLAAYLIKETSKTFRQNDGGHKQRYSCSRNLIRPKPKTEIIRAERWLPEPKARKGYYIDKDYTENGYSGITGKPFQRYIMVRISDDTGGFL